jgi:hypothetical protein
MIPKILHITHSDPMTTDFQVKRWTNESINCFMVDNYPTIPLSHAIYYILYYYGGIYMGQPYKIKKSLDVFLKYPFICVMNELTDRIDNDILGCVKNNPIICIWATSTQKERLTLALTHTKIINPVYFNYQISLIGCQRLGIDSEYYFTTPIHSARRVVRNVALSFYRNNEKPLNLTCSSLRIISENASLPKKNLIVVAHPDDEILWFGEFLINHTRDTKVLCITNASSSERSSEFLKVMKEVKCEYEMWDFQDRDVLNIYSIDLQNQLAIAITNYANVYTHSLSGEYGHPQHILLYHCLYQIPNINLFITNLYNLTGRISQRKYELLDMYKKQKVTKFYYLSKCEDYIQIKSNSSN